MELSLSRSGQCCIFLKVYPLHVFLSLVNLNIQVQEATKENPFYSLCEKFCVRTHPKHMPEKPRANTELSSFSPLLTHTKLYQNACLGDYSCKHSRLCLK